MKKAALYVLFCTLALLGAVSSANAKGPVDKIAITGPQLTEPIEITKSKALQDMNPWMGAFVDWWQGSIAEPPQVGLPYEVSFYLKSANDHFRTIYVIEYYPDPSGERGYIYLPGPGERWYRTNIGTIIRDGDDGRWHYATEEWDELIQPLLGNGGGSPESATQLSVGMDAGQRVVAPRTIILAVALVVLVVLAVAGTVLAFALRRPVSSPIRSGD